MTAALKKRKVVAQTLADYGVEVNPREVSTEIWSDSITGTEGLPRSVDYDAQIWGLAGGDVDNPSSVNVVGLGVNLNSWNKSTTDVEPWEITMDRLSRRMDATLDLDARVEIYNQACRAHARVPADYTADQPCFPLLRKYGQRLAGSRVRRQQHRITLYARQL